MNDIISSRLRNYFFNGVVIFISIVATAYVVWVVFNFLDGLLSPFVDAMIGVHIPGLGLLVALLLILLIGGLTGIALGRKIVDFLEGLLLRIPIVRGIYSIIKQVSATFLLPQSQGFKKVVLVEFPRKGMYSLGFTTGTTVGEIQEKTRERVINVFIPTSPNPTSGFFVMVPEASLIYLDMSVQKAVRFVISGGFSK